MRVTAERFDAAAAAVMADLFGDEPAPVTVRWIPPGDDPEFGEMLVEAPDGERFGYTVFPDSTDDDLRYQLAERIPEYLPELTVTWAGVFLPAPATSTRPRRVGTSGSSAASGAARATVAGSPRSGRCATRVMHRDSRPASAPRARRRG